MAARTPSSSPSGSSPSGASRSPQTSSQKPPAIATESLRRRRSRRAIAETLWTILAGLCLVVALVPLVLVIAYVAVKGASRLDLAAFTELPPPPLMDEGGGFANALVGTVVMVTLGAGFSVPVGLLAAIYLSEFAPPARATWIRFAANILSGVPSILIGVFVYGLLVATQITGYSAIAGGSALALLMLPTVVRTTDESLQLVSQDIRWAAASIGASPATMVLQVVLPAALPAIATGVSLAVARAAGETAPLIFTALFAQYWSFDPANPIDTLFQPIASLSVLIYNFATVPYDNQNQLAWAASLVLVAIVLLTSILSQWVVRRRAG